MALAKDYDSVMARSGDINLKALGIDYKEFESRLCGLLTMRALWQRQDIRWRK